ncbi:N(2)-acetyl-L-2,4-diaminobutanoate deacetylase DoeB2 [Malaciobacter marinus]|uniref:N(2)-acetyl-L-2,4-diaminobutanoate deacetylase DoeB2 n=1 Tax=Malaciobacter marinus TaxID=505249 RepID=UPI000C08897E|nr:MULTISPECIES: N(2)-acetyl-L-2,4-diaminobutanoate deacetylase DoeB2 [Malaciobacter]PHO13657.1 peptidase M20 [Malaciobacter marinus]RYA23959.1 amidohydrolase [Malaciobacter halophilus]
MKLKWIEIIEFAKKFRKELHKNPELTWEEIDTAKAIRATLKAHYTPYKEFAHTGTVVTLAPNAKGTHIALRGDIDALEIDEQTTVPYKSQKPNCMHACGHDGHTATLLATAIWLKQHEDQLPGPVSLVFQPAEEGGHGAKKMLEEEALKGVEFIYGWHNWPAIKFGQAICPDGVVMAGNGTFHIDINGQGGHSSQPEISKDPVLAASAITMALQQIVSRRIAPQKAGVVSVTSIDARSGLTTIPSHAKIEGSIRIPDLKTRDEVAKSIKEIAQNTAKAYNTEAIVEFRNRYSPTINHENAASSMREKLEEVLGKDYKSDIATPIMASEDFSYYLQEIPGAFALIGSNDGQEKHTKPCHNAYYDFNDELIEPVCKVFTKLANLECEFI